MTTDLERATDYITSGYVNADEFPSHPFVKNNHQLDEKGRKPSDHDKDYVQLLEPRERYTTLRKQDSGDLYDSVTIPEYTPATVSKLHHRRLAGRKVIFALLLLIVFVVGAIGLVVATISLTTPSSNCGCQSMEGEMEKLKSALQQLGALHNLTFNI